MGTYERLSGHLAGPVPGWVTELRTRFGTTTPAKLFHQDSEIDLMALHRPPDEM